MAVLTYSIALMFVGMIIALAFHGVAGIGLMVVAAGGILYSVISYFESDRTTTQEDLDSYIEDVLRRNPRP